MKPSLLLSVLFTCGFFVSLPAVARAEIVFGESIEWVIADSERVFMGNVAKVERVGDHEVVTVKVAKTFRGKHEAQVTFVVQKRGGWSGQGWLKFDVPMVFCLIPRERLKNTSALLKEYDWFLRPGVAEHSAVFLGKAELLGTIDVITRDFNFLMEPDAIIKYVEAYTKLIPANWTKKRLVLHVPTETPAYKQLWRGSGVLLSVPADAQMETLGRAWCRDKAVYTRALGAGVLREFKNEENIKLLKSLLRDPEFDNVSGSQSFPDHILRYEDRVFPARAAAYQALRDLGIQVERPVLEIPLKRTKEQIPGKKKT